MGAVYLGRDAELNRQVAIKVIRGILHDQEILDRFFREARAAAALRHPNIVTIYASGQHEQQPYIAMEFVEGDSLADIIRERRPLTLADKLAYIDQICAGLHVAHRAGIVHRDIKPANIMVDREGIVRILDFGIARIEGSAVTQDGALMGSLNYMSPEQMLGHPVDHRSDIFSVGSLAYEVLSYPQAFKGSLGDGLLQRLPNEDPPPLTQLYPGLPPGIDQVVMRALQKAPGNRFQNLADMRAALHMAHGEGLPSSSDATIVVPRTDTPPPSRAAFSLSDAADRLRAMAMEAHHGVDDDADQVTPAVEAVPSSPSSQVSEPPPSGEHPPVESKPATPPPQRAITMNKPPAPVVKMKPPATSTRPLTTRARPQDPAVARSSWKRIVIAGAVAVVIGAAIVAIPRSAIPRFTAEPSPLERELPRVVEAMERFRAAYRNRDLDGVVAVFPSLPRDLSQDMQRAFASCLLYEVMFSGMQVKLNPEAAQAQVDVRSTHTCTSQSNGRQTTTSRDDLFTLQRQRENWVIDSVVPAPVSAKRSR